MPNLTFYGPPAAYNGPVLYIHALDFDSVGIFGARYIKLILLLLTHVYLF